VGKAKYGVAIFGVGLFYGVSEVSRPKIGLQKKERNVNQC